MILIIGGAFQGKNDFAENILKLDKNKILFDFHKKMKYCVEEDIENASTEKQDELLKLILSGEYEAVISDEIGCGIVPIDKFERSWRESTGRALCRIAENSDEVWRVQCGIGNRIK